MEANGSLVESMEPRRRRAGRRAYFLRVPRAAESVRSLLETASEEEREKAHRLVTGILEWWLGQRRKEEVATSLGVSGLRLWQLSQRATAGMGVVHLFSMPRTPQHNAVAERGMREIKETTSLGAGRELAALTVERAEVVFARGGRAPALKLTPARDEEWPLELEEACLALNDRARPSRGGRSATELDRILPHWDHRICRESFHRAAMEEIERASAAAPSVHARRKAVREAIYFTLEAFGLVKRTRGGRPLPGPNSEGER